MRDEQKKNPQDVCGEANRQATSSQPTSATQIRKIRALISSIRYYIAAIYNGCFFMNNLGEMMKEFTAKQRKTSRISD